jgi:heme exporter protein B
MSMPASTKPESKSSSITPQAPIGILDALARSLAVFLKDVTSEYRTRYAVNAIALFAVTTLLAISFAIGGGVGLDSTVQASLLWIIIYFSAMTGLSRAFVHEEDSHTAGSLRLAAPPGTIFGGKLLFNLALIIALELVIVPLFVGMMNVKVNDWPLFLLILFTGSSGLAVASTIVAAIVSRANTKGALFAVLAFPLLLPLIITAIQGTQTAFSDRKSVV